MPRWPGMTTCSATSTTTGERCGRAPAPGSDVCKRHGAAAPQVKAAAARRVAEAKIVEQASAELARLNVEPIGDPLAELSKLAGQAVAWKDRMGARVNKLTEIRYEGGLGTEQLRAEIALFERAMDRCASVLTGMARLDIDERMTGIRSRTADMLTAALEAALAATGLDVERQWQARDVFRSHLVFVRPLSEAPECTQAELVEGEIRSLESRTTGWGDK